MIHCITCTVGRVVEFSLVAAECFGLWLHECEELNRSLQSMTMFSWSHGLTWYIGLAVCTFFSFLFRFFCHTTLLNQFITGRGDIFYGAVGWLTLPRFWAKLIVTTWATYCCSMVWAICNLTVNLLCFFLVFVFKSLFTHTLPPCLYSIPQNLEEKKERKDIKGKLAFFFFVTLKIGTRKNKGKTKREIGKF